MTELRDLFSSQLGLYLQESAPVIWGWNYLCLNIIKKGSTWCSCQVVICYMLYITILFKTLTSGLLIFLISKIQFLHVLLFVVLTASLNESLLSWIACTVSLPQLMATTFCNRSILHCDRQFYMRSFFRRNFSCPGISGLWNLIWLFLVW